MPDLENQRAEAPATPTDRAKLFRMVILLIDQVYLVEYFLCLFQADAVLSLDVPALLSIEFDPHRPV